MSKQQRYTEEFELATHPVAEVVENGSAVRMATIARPSSISIGSDGDCAGGVVGVNASGSEVRLKGPLLMKAIPVR